MKHGLVMADYYELPFVSNSDLGALRKEIYGIEEITNLDFHYAFGSLVDAMLTEPQPIIDDARKDYDFTAEHLSMADKMVEYCLKDPLIPLMLKKAVGQHVYIRTMDFEQDGFEFKMKCRCKFDLLAKPMKMGLDFKTLSVTTNSAFKASIDHFDYDRQSAFYMDLARLERFWIIGISKKNAAIFKLAIQRGDDVYNSGRNKYMYWGRRYFDMVYNLNLE